MVIETGFEQFSGTVRNERVPGGSQSQNEHGDTGSRRDSWELRFSCSLLLIGDRRQTQGRRRTTYLMVLPAPLTRFVTPELESECSV